MRIRLFIVALLATIGSVVAIGPAAAAVSPVTVYYSSASDAPTLKVDKGGDTAVRTLYQGDHYKVPGTYVRAMRIMIDGKSWRQRWDKSSGAYGGCHKAFDGEWTSYLNPNDAIKGRLDILAYSGSNHCTH
jgi:hypothetical protein